MRQGDRPCQPFNASGGSGPLREIVQHTVEMPMVRKAVTSVALRPMRSPKCPNEAGPLGRAKNARAKVANDCSCAVAGSPLGKNSRGNTSTAAVA
jgi:hypothetical protein